MFKLKKIHEKSCKRNHIDSGPAKVVATVVEACPKIIQGLVKTLEQVNTIFQQFVGT